MQPSPMADTTGPFLPSCLVFMPHPPFPDQPSLTAVPLTLTMSMPFFSPRTS